MSAVLHRPAPLGGPVVTKGARVLVVLAALGVAAMVTRFAVGLGGATALNDGYPWGLWIAFDVVTGTALGCGGYAVALLVYVLNKGEFHPAVRPALLTGALGYSLAAVSILLDVGRPWLLHRVPLYVSHWNTSSALFEVALCVMTYVAVLWIEVSPSFLDSWRKGPAGLKRTLGESFLPVVEKALPFVIALGLLLPTMHQSSLGTLMLLSGKKLHALWSTPLLPLLFLISSLAMGYAVVIFESTLSSVAFKRPREGKMLAALGKVVVPFLWAWAGIRLVDVVLRGKLAFFAKPDGYVLLFLVEIALIVVPAVMLASPERRADAGALFRAAILMILAGTLYRIDTFIVAFRPGAQYAYFPSLAEILATVGIVAIEILAYVWFVKRFPILTGAAPAHAAAASQVR
ncbi:MAG: NrfD/PsrC family molybdoenzyme membrane anchor subunit [Acidobacteriota bacterium]